MGNFVFREKDNCFATFLGACVIIILYFITTIIIIIIINLGVFLGGGGGQSWDGITK